MCIACRSCVGQAQGGLARAATMQAALNVALAVQMKNMSLAGGGELVTLSRGHEGDIVNRACVERWFDLVHTFWEAELWLPTTTAITEALYACDATYDHKLSNASTKAARRRWATFEAEKIHLILSYTARLCRRASSSPSAKVMLLKKLWLRRRSADGLLEAGPQQSHVQKCALCLELNLLSQTGLPVKRHGVFILNWSKCLACCRRCVFVWLVGMLWGSACACIYGCVSYPNRVIPKGAGPRGKFPVRDT